METETNTQKMKTFTIKGKKTLRAIILYLSLNVCMRTLCFTTDVLNQYSQLIIAILINQ